MPLTPRRSDPRARRRLPPRPTYSHEPASAAAPGDEARVRREVERAHVAADRESRFLIAELKRVAGVTATCIGMLVVLAILQRLQA